MPPAPIRRPKFDVEAFTNKLFDGILEDRVPELVTRQDVHRLLYEVRRVFRAQPMFLHLTAPMIVCGDLHGQFNDLMRIFESQGFPHYRNYLFLGDYVDRGSQSVELILFMFACKIRYPRNFFMLRGNHETQSINQHYGFHRELTEKYGSQKLYEAFQIVFEFMPLSAVISDKVLCMHGGLGKELLDARRLDILNNIPRPLLDKNINPQENPLAVNLLWADPDVNARLFGISRRGLGNIFGQEVIDRVRNRFGLDLIIRAHQVVLDGIEFFAGDINSGLITVFSAPHYCGMYDNSGAVVRVSADLGVSFKIFKPDFPEQPQN